MALKKDPLHLFLCICLSIKISLTTCMNKNEAPSLQASSLLTCLSSLKCVCFFFNKNFYFKKSTVSVARSPDRGREIKIQSTKLLKLLLSGRPLHLCGQDTVSPPVNVCDRNKGGVSFPRLFSKVVLENERTQNFRLQLRKAGKSRRIK